MGHLIGRGRYGRETYPSPPPASGGGASPTPPLQVVNTGNIPSGGAAQTYLVVLGGDGMPAPASYTTTTGRVKVTVQLQAEPNPNAVASYTVDFVRDGAIVPFGAEARLVSTTAAVGDGLGPTLSGTFVGIDTVAPGSTHSWGIQVQGTFNEGGAPETSLVNIGRACIIVEDIVPSP